MRRYRRYGYGGPPIARPWRAFRSAFWMIGLAFLFFWGHWWPGILILVGIDIVLGMVFRAGAQTWNQNPPPPFDPTPMPTMPMTPAAAAPVADPIHRTDLLPSNCPNCGAPIRTNEVKWTGNQAASCGYCGTNLPMKRQ